MSTPQWQNLPVPPNSDRPAGAAGRSQAGGEVWAAFSADPREAQYQHLRASDADHGLAASLLADAHADGRLDQDEYEQRLNQATSAKSLGELVPVLDDLTPQRASADQGEEACMPGMLTAKNARASIAGLPRWWLGLAVMFNLIWLLSVLGTGGWIYYWPMWPMLGTAIPVILGWINGGQGRPDRQQAQLPPATHGDDLR